MSQCEPEAAPPQYGGGAAVNPDFDNGLKGWVGVGNAQLSSGLSPFGNNYAVISNIVEAQSDGASQHFRLDRDMYYVVSGEYLCPIVFSL